MTRLSATLETILHVLHDRGMDDVLLREGEPVRLRKGDTLVQVSRDVLGRDQIVRMLDQRASGDTAPQVWPTEVVLSDGRTVQVDVMQPSDAPNRLEVVLARRTSDRSATTPAGTAAVPTEPPPSSESLPHPARRATDRGWGPYPTREAALLDLERLLRKQVQSGAADLHLRVGEPPVLRQRGDLARMEGEAPLNDAHLTAMVTAAMPPRNETEFAENSDTDFAHEIEGAVAFPRERAQGSQRHRRGVPHDLVRHGHRRGDGHQPRSPPALLPEQGTRARHRAHGIGQVDDALRADRPRSTHAHRSHHHDRRSDRVRAPEQEVPGHAARRSACTRTASRARCARRCARIPDIVLVGEMRDLETIAIAIETAETGHLVFGTLHTTTAAGTVDRIIDQFPADRQEQIRVMLSESLKGVDLADAAARRTAAAASPRARSCS